MSTLYDQLLGHKRQPLAAPRGGRRSQALANALGTVFGVSPCPTGLAVAAVTAKRGGWEFDAGRSVCLGLESPDQRGMRQLAWDFDQVAKDLRISSLYLREPAGTGPSRADTRTHYLVALLLLTPNIRLEIIHPATIRAWRRQMEPVLPRPSEVEVPPQLGNKLVFNLFDRAIECAAFIAQREAIYG